MAKGKPRILSGELGELSLENSNWFDFYENHPHAPKSKSHRNKVRKFLRYKKHNKKPFQEFEQADVENFIAMLTSAEYNSGGSDPYISAISNCAKILREEHTGTFPEDFLSTVSKLRKNETSKPSGEILSLVQISLIKKYMLDKSDIHEQYIFEELFSRGFQLEELYDHGKNKYPEGNFEYRARRYFEKLTIYLKDQGVYSKTKKINSDHFKKSHQAYFFKCPICQESFENIAENWMLVRTELDNEYRLVCAACKGKIKWK